MRMVITLALLLLAVGAAIAAYAIKAASIEAKLEARALLQQVEADRAALRALEAEVAWRSRVERLRAAAPDFALAPSLAYDAQWPTLSGVQAPAPIEPALHQPWQRFSAPRREERAP